jgi:predicted HAD superfamily Cof-like phosphohydrolase
MTDISNDVLLPADEFTQAMTPLARALATSKLLQLPFYVYDGVMLWRDDSHSPLDVKGKPIDQLWVALEMVAASALNSGDVQQLLVRTWMRLAGQETPEQPTLSTYAVQQLRLRLIREECNELEEAYEAGDLAAVFDAVADLLYVLHGTAVAHGFEDHPPFVLVHENNVLKIERGHKDDGGKWIKPADHQPPDFQSELIRQLRLTAPRAGGGAVTCTCEQPNSAHPADAAPFIFLTVLCDGRRLKL